MFKTIILTLALILASSGLAYTQPSFSTPRTKIEEEDGSNSSRYRVLKVTDGSLTDNNDGSGSLSIYPRSEADTTFLKLDCSNDPLQPASDSSTFFQVSKADGTVVFNIDSTNERVGIGTATPGEALEVVGTVLADKFEVDDGNSYIDTDGSNNMTFTDAVTGTRTLKQLGCPTYKYIKAVTQSEGDLNLSDGPTWAVSKALIKSMRIVTSSTDWDLYILQNDNTFATDDANIGKVQLAGNVNGNSNIYMDLPYEDEDASAEVHLYYLDNSGANTADIYIMGYELL